MYIVSLQMFYPSLSCPSGDGVLFSGTVHDSVVSGSTFKLFQRRILQSRIIIKFKQIIVRVQAVITGSNY